jgi:glutamate/tyrosine decarboxylase-like PLP-dependent enzyme
VAADFLTSAWGQNAGNHVASPAAAAAETTAASWLLDLLDLPRAASVGFVTGATMANFVCLAAARGALLRRAGWDVEADGLFAAPPIRVLLGEDAHSTVFAALQYLGFGRARVERIATDAQGRMDPADLAARRGSGPALVIAQAGQINTGAIDDLAAIRAAAPDAWLHVDGAFGLWARACPAIAAQAAGAERADSWAVDGHKWLQTPYDCGFAIVRDAEAHRAAMNISASYLPPVAAGERDPTDYVPELSRRARGFAAWAMIRHLGRAGIAAMIAEHCRIAGWMAARLAGEPGIAVLNAVTLNQIILRFGDDDRLTLATIARLQSDGTAYAGGGQWRGTWVMRLSITGGPTTPADAAITCDAIIAAWRACTNG